MDFIIGQWSRKNSREITQQDSFDAYQPVSLSCIKLV